jgi:ABC-2 type transport system permease protein
MFAIVWLRFDGTDIGYHLPDWNFIAWTRSLVIEFGVLLGGVLWYAPIAAYFMLLSAWARRLVFLWAIVPLLAIPALEGMFFHSANFARFMGHRFGGFVLQLNIDPKALETGVGQGVDRVPRVEDVYKALDLTGMFTSYEVWIGLAAAAAMAYAAIRLRRYRDDT